MARRADKVQEAAQKQVVYSGSYEIVSPRWSNDNRYCAFSLRLPELGITLYGLRLMYSKDEGFIAFPSWKGKDGRYWKHYYVAFSGPIKSAIIAELEAC